jgi:hypothetical protein
MSGDQSLAIKKKPAIPVHLSKNIRQTTLPAGFFGAMQLNFVSAGNTSFIWREQRGEDGPRPTKPPVLSAFRES